MRLFAPSQGIQVLAIAFKYNTNNQGQKPNYLQHIRDTSDRTYIFIFDQINKIFTGSYESRKGNSKAISKFRESIVNPHIFKQPDSRLVEIPLSGLEIEQKDVDEMINDTGYTGYVRRLNDVYSDQSKNDPMKPNETQTLIEPIF